MRPRRRPLRSALRCEALVAADPRPEAAERAELADTEDTACQEVHGRADGKRRTDRDDLPAEGPSESLVEPVPRPEAGAAEQHRGGDDPQQRIGRLVEFQPAEPPPQQ